ncbi:SGNH/GDSL hydrolase family protein [Cryobacterium melibiosiphilum]|uniref:SGNH/GDSL hydrolase family protein n=1 Tax=Cryobacterium melibiosiphilum TaxID=995039 RepID=A0A3A5MCZ1_9MICO|nr:SGNH/GDSL hydrolase family protein [Cryobacterium melibiosiphilum]RJT87342.1 SGNH/GDSL hydrolase family protein [Cryobacterium melibiosiphilum]
MREVLRFILAPLIRAWAGLALQTQGTVPRPTDHPHSHATGPDHDRVLVFGSGPATGWGVRTHDLALPGSLARALSVTTGRGADVSVAASPLGSIRQGFHDVAEIDLSAYHAVVVALGVNDAIDFIPPTVWRSELARILTHISEHTGPQTHIYMLGIQPIRTIPVFDNRLFGGLANWHAAGLNRVTSDQCSRTPRTTFVPLTGRSFIVAGRYRTSTDYQQWGEFLATEMADDLTATSLIRH